MAEEALAVTTILSAAVLGVLAVAAGYVLSWANRVFHVDVDAKVEAILAALPGANCGACGFLGCAEYAEAVVKGEAEVNLCIPGGVHCAQSLAKIMGVEVSETYPYRAVVHCAACEDQRLQRAEYHGEPTCAAANLVAYVQGCTYGCLGLGDCVQACKHDAIHIIRGLATVDYGKCDPQVNFEPIIEQCPRESLVLVGEPGKRQLTTVPGEGLPECVKAENGTRCRGSFQSHSAITRPPLYRNMRFFGCACLPILIDVTG